LALRDPLYAAYERRLRRSLKGATLPRHVGVMLDGNRRWAKARGAGTKEGHQAGADNIAHFLSWCEDAGVEVVTLWLLSTDNLNRPAAELAPLLEIIENTVADLAETGRWRINPVGSPDLLPAETARRLKESADATAGVTGMVVNVAVGYGGRQEITDAVRSLLIAHAANGTTIRSWPRRSRWSTSRSTSTPRASPTRTSSSGPPASSACPGSCCGRARTASSTSARPTGPTSGMSTSCAP
jgi:short-chain Z-isoprenyl diphosphate synthase